MHGMRPALCERLSLSAVRWLAAFWRRHQRAAALVRNDDWYHDRRNDQKDTNCSPWAQVRTRAGLEPQLPGHIRILARDYQQVERRLSRGQWPRIVIGAHAGHLPSLGHHADAP